MADRIVGIDLGTSTSAVAALDQGQARILFLDERERVIPTVVGINQAGNIIVGSTAKDQLETNPEYTFTGLKRLLGRKADDPQIVSWSQMVAYEIVAGPRGEAFVRGPDKIYDPVDLIAHVFAKLREIARQSLGEEVTRCVVGVPAHFDVTQKEAIKRAAQLGVFADDAGTPGLVVGARQHVLPRVRVRAVADVVEQRGDHPVPVAPGVGKVQRGVVADLVRLVLGIAGEV